MSQEAFQDLTPQTQHSDRADSSVFQDSKRQVPHIQLVSNKNIDTSEDLADVWGELYPDWDANKAADFNRQLINRVVKRERIKE